jgi:peptidoglycan/LPS O-acetylase OafA/YrhL
MTLEGDAAAPPAPAPAHESLVEQAERAERSAGSHFPCLDAYRAIGMSMVLLNHAAYATGYLNHDDTLARILIPMIARLDMAVPMFFVLSGFLLYRPFAMATLADRPLGRARVYLRRRALRIFPAYWFALVALGLLFGLPIVGAKAWIGNALLLPAFGVPVEACGPAGQCHVAYGITQAWSIGVEVTFYLSLPVLAMIGHRLARGRSVAARTAVLLGLDAAIYAVGTAFRVYVVSVRPSWDEQSLLWLPMFLDLFAIGMALAVISAAASLGRPVPRALAWLGAHPWLSWGVTALVFFVVTRLEYPDRPFGLHSTDGSSDYLPRQFLYGLASALWLAPAIFGDQSRSRLRQLLASRPLVYLGVISLSFYLWHLEFIEKVKAWTVPDWDVLVERAAHPRPGNTLDAVGTFAGSFSKVALVAWIISFFVASVVYYVVERPFQRLKEQPLRALVRPGRLR